jgi:hypothetical protein
MIYLFISVEEVAFQFWQLRAILAILAITRAQRSV